jgi:PAS domain S-box-containing protein
MSTSLKQFLQRRFLLAAFMPLILTLLLLMGMEFSPPWWILSVGILTAAALSLLLAKKAWQQVTAPIPHICRYADTITSRQPPEPPPTPAWQEFEPLASQLQQLADAVEQRETSLRMDRDYFREIFNAIEDPIIINYMDPDGFTGRFIDVNDATCRRLGYTREELKALAPKDIHIPGSVSPENIAIQLRNTGHMIFEAEQVAKNGERVPVEIHLHSFLLAGRRVVIGVGRDIRRRIETETRLFKTTRQLQALIDASPLGVMATDQRGNLTLFNAAAEKLLGWNAKKVLGAPPPSIHESERERFGRIIERLNRGERVIGLELKALHKNGSLVDVSMSCAPLMDENGRLFGTMAMFLDIRDRLNTDAQKKKLERRLQQARKMESLAVLSGGIAHDFNNMLMGIMGNAELALLHLPPKSPARRSVTQIETAAKKASTLSLQMLAYSGRGTLIRRALDLSETVRAMETVLEKTFHLKATFIYNLADNLPLIEGDSAQLRQVIMNLVMNATEAMSEDRGSISISTGQIKADAGYLAETYPPSDLPEGTYVYTEISDNGCGMAPEMRANIFDPFFTTKTVGRGLGLAAVIGIVKGHKGVVKVDSLPEMGTSIRMLFPVLHKSLPRESGADSGAGAGNRGRLVLLADDEDLVRTVGQNMLERFGFRVLTAENGSEALNIFKAHAEEISAAILDINMPGMNGVRVFEEIRKIKTDLPVVFSSGRSEDAVPLTMETKRIAFLQKPYTSAQMMSKIQHILEKKT